MDEPLFRPSPDLAQARKPLSRINTPSDDVTVQPRPALTFLSQVADEVALASDDSIEVIAALTGEFLSASAAGISTIDSASRLLRIAALVPRPRANDFYVWQSLPLDRGFPGGAAVLNAATYALSTRAEILQTFPRVTEYPVGDKAQALYCAPLIRHAEIVGTLFAVWDDEHQLSPEELVTMRIVSTLAAHALD